MISSLFCESFAVPALSDIGSEKKCFIFGLLLELCDCYHGTAGRYYSVCICISVCMCNLLLFHLHIVRPRHTVLLIGFPVIRKAVAGVCQRKEVLLTQGPMGTLLFLCGVQGLGSWSDRNLLSLFFTVRCFIWASQCRECQSKPLTSARKA